MKHIKKTTALVKEILKEVPATRDNDMLLYYHVALEIDRKVLKIPFYNVILDLKGHGLPSIETVGRARRKLQREYPELRGSDKASAIRTVQEEKFREYAKAVIM
jgi:hypothetical protein